MAIHAAQTRGLVAAFGSTFFELVGFFMLMPLLQFTLSARGVGASGIGLFTALDWVGVFLVTPFAGRLARRFGERPCFWVSGTLPLIAAAGFLVTDRIAIWCGLFCLMGLSSGLRWVVAEALVAQWSPTRLRGRIVGLFQTMIGITFMIGPAALAAVGTQDECAYWIVLTLLAIGAAVSFTIPAPIHARTAAQAQPALGVRAALASSRAMMAAGFVGGVFEVGLSGLLPVLGLSIGYDTGAASLLVAISGIGSTALMLPAGALADRLDRRRVSIAFAAVLLASTIMLIWLRTHTWLAWPLAFLWGGAGGALYTLAMVQLGMVFSGPILVERAAVLVMTYTLGGILAPPIGGYALDHLPGWSFAMIFALIACAGMMLLVGSKSRGTL